MAVWPAAWRANLPWAGQAQANQNVLEMHGVILPDVGASLATLLGGSWKLVKHEVELDNGVNDIFDVVGSVLIQGVFAVVTVDVARAGGAVTGKIGTVSDDDLIIGATTDIRTAAGDIWFSAADPAETGVQVDLSGDHCFVVTDGENIIATCGAAPDTGKMEFYCFYKALSADGAVVPS